MANAPSPSPTSSFSFDLTRPTETSSSSRFGPRLGKARLVRTDGSPDLTIETPGLLTTTSRGIVPHLSRDHHRRTAAIRWVGLPFETFLEQVPPVPTLQGGPHPLHTFLGYPPARNTLVLSLRDPACAKQLPPNGKDHISALSLRGVRKVSKDEWRGYVAACNPDLVPRALHRMARRPPPPIPPTQSQSQSDTTTTDTTAATHPLNVLVHMAGGASIPARTAFAESLTEPLYGPDAALVQPLATLDQGVAGYTFDLVPLRNALGSAAPLGLASAPDTPDTAALAPLLRASLAPLPATKLRLANSPASPHEILRLVRDVGVDVFDAAWAQGAADIGVALDFVFPVPVPVPDAGSGLPDTEGGKIDLGHNLYDDRYASDFSRLADSLRAGNTNAQSTPTSTFISTSLSGSDSPAICPCAACSPLPPTAHIAHSNLDALSFPPKTNADADADAALPRQSCLPPFSRAYIHHLLHTHEMSAHALLVMHNLAVLDAFFAGVRAVLRSKPKSASSFGFAGEVERFVRRYEEGAGVFERARGMWAGVDRARGKGRLGRERAKNAPAVAETLILGDLVPVGETTLPPDTIIDLEV
ncbi:hypothetical protein FIBSPDRAFT_1042913 [Athelia psychrophila]|uniref:tRNA-guanine(15) transglycosylase-like domain-containing protein n=1 Tax=Athelia psychrophila TaxID=1759441 RepID=A0A166LZ51_9AGAM|nr:hypothetical protein FIBSPDRAFT_1042913 [Fibularhizoctonia sp. CBS 109695]